MVVPLIRVTSRRTPPFPARNISAGVMGGRVQGCAGADPRARTTIGASDNGYAVSCTFHLTDN
jgi:hypothetical protein